MNDIRNLWVTKLSILSTTSVSYSLQLVLVP